MSAKSDRFEEVTRAILEQCRTSLDIAMLVPNVNWPLSLERNGKSMPPLT